MEHEQPFSPKDLQRFDALSEKLNKASKIDKITQGVFMAAALTILGELGYGLYQSTTNHAESPSAAEGITLFVSLAVGNIAGGIAVHSSSKNRKARTELRSFIQSKIKDIKN